MSTTEGSYPACSAACFKNSNCKSFAFSGNTWKDGDCQLYDVVVSKNFVADSSSPYYFYDIGCEKSQKFCNKNGVFTGKDEDVTGAADTYSSPPSGQSYSQCYGMCNSDPNYKSFCWNKVSCITFDVPLSGNFNETWDTDTSIFYYDVSCGDSSSTSSSTTATTTTSIKTSTKAPATTTTTKTTTKQSA